MFPGSNANAEIGYNKHSQYMTQPPHFLAAPGVGPSTGRTALAANTPEMPLNMQGSIDWAQLAQQWIHMRDSTPAPPLANFSVNMPIAPPPPIISTAPEYQQQQQQLELRQQQPSKGQTLFEEHGEAEMDMDMDMDEDDEDNPNNGRTIHGIESLHPPHAITQAQWIGGTEMSLMVHPNDAGLGAGSQQWSNWSTRANPTAHIPSLLKLNVCNPNEPPPQLSQTTAQPMHNSSNNNSGVSNVSSDIDANKRKMLPAWIREGLEKMEREKQRQLERQQPITPEIVSPSINVKQVSSKTLTTPVNLLNLSNVASDSEDSITTPEEAAHVPSLAQRIGNDVLSRATAGEEHENKDEEEDEDKIEEQDAADSGLNVEGAREVNADAALSGKNYEERLADLMLVVRRTLTEILLETTNEEIAAIATETLKAHRAKASSAQVIRKSALSSITGNLGLAEYGDSSSENDEDDPDGNGGDQVERNLDKEAELSTDELKARIRRSKRAFEKVIDDIEERVSLQEKIDEQKLQENRKLELLETQAAQSTVLEQRDIESPADDGTTATPTVPAYDKLQHFNSKRLSRKERTTRFSDNKDGKHSQSYVSQVQVAVAAAAKQSSTIPQKLKAVPNPATNLLQMPESMVSMLSAANKALDKAQKTSKKTKSRRHQSSSSSSSSSSGDSSSSSSSSSNTSSNSSKSSSKSASSSTHSSAATKKHRSSRRHQSRGNSSRRHRSDTSSKGHRKGHSSNSNKHHSSRVNRESERDRDRHALHYSQYNQHKRRHQKRESSNSAEEDGAYCRTSRHSTSRSHQSRSYGKHRQRTRSRSDSRSTHNSHSSTSTTHHQRKRH